MKLKDRLKVVESSLDVKNWLPDYTFKKWIFRSALIIIVLFAVIAWGLLGFGSPYEKYFYLSCPDNFQVLCMNPFYDLCNVKGALYYEQNSICKELNSNMYENKFLVAGEELGTKPDSFAGIIISNSWFIVLLAFIINHLAYNKGYFKKKDWDKFKGEFGGKTDEN